MSDTPRTVLGRTGLEVSRLALGAGPVSGLMTGADEQQQRAVLERAVARGINWIDTAPGYGQGRSEENLGRTLRTLAVSQDVHIATKVRVDFSAAQSLSQQIEHSVAQSRARLGCERITLLQLHNGITRQRNDEAASLAPQDVLECVLPLLRSLRQRGDVQFLGLTGTGHPDALREVIRSGEFDTIQTPYHLLNPSAGEACGAEFRETNYGNILADCAEQQMGVFAIRVYAAGALLNQPPSAHTKMTPYFPLALYERDLAHAQRLAAQCGWETLKAHALRFVLSHPHIHSAIVGFGTPEHVDEAVQICVESRE